jgi:hypothetical protein
MNASYFFFQVNSCNNSKPFKVTVGRCTGFTSSCVRRLLRFGLAKGEIAAMAKPYCCKEAQAAPLHERGHAALSVNKNYYSNNYFYF